MAAYSKVARPTIQSAGGKVVIADREMQVIEGDWHGSLLVVVEFEDEQAFRAWYDSPAYQEALKLRDVASDSRAVLAKGLG